MSIATLYLKNKFPKATVTEEDGYAYVGDDKYSVVTSEALVDAQFFRTLDCCKLLLVAPDSTILEYSISELPTISN